MLKIRDSSWFYVNGDGALLLQAGDTYERIHFDNNFTIS